MSKFREGDTVQAECKEGTLKVLGFNEDLYVLQDEKGETTWREEHQMKLVKASNIHELAMWSTLVIISKTTVLWYLGETGVVSAEEVEKDLAILCEEEYNYFKDKPLFRHLLNKICVF